MKKLIVPQKYDNKKLTKFILDSFPKLSPNMLYKALRQKDIKIDGLYWAIPTSDLSHRTTSQLDYYNKCLKCEESDLRSCYYHIVRGNRTALYKISSCYPITDKYIDHAYTVNQKHVIIKRNKDKNEFVLQLCKRQK